MPQSQAEHTQGLSSLTDLREDVKRRVSFSFGHRLNYLTEQVSSSPKIKLFKSTKQQSVSWLVLKKGSQRPDFVHTKYIWHNKSSLVCEIKTEYWICWNVSRPKQGLSKLLTLVKYSSNQYQHYSHDSSLLMHIHCQRNG